MNLFSLYLLLTFLVTGAWASSPQQLQWYKNKISFYSCVYTIFYMKGAKFCPPTEKNCVCSNENSRATIAGCLSYKDRYTPAQGEFAIYYCREYFHTNLESDWYYKALANFTERAKYLKDIDIPADNITNVPIKSTPQEMELYVKVAKNFLGNYDDSIWYGVSVFGFWFIVLMVYAISHWSKMLFPGFTKKLTGPGCNIYRKYITMPALYGKRKSQAMAGFKVFDSLIPTRFEIIVIILFYIFIVIIHAVNSTAVDNDPVFGSKYQAELRYVADRTGIVGTIMMPLVILFAGRNNFLQWICGINSSTFLCYHRHIARVMFILIAIHSVNYTIIYGEEYGEELLEPWLYWGLVATIVGGLILMQSILYLRRNWYEIFLLVHIFLAVLYIAGTWIHIVDLGYGSILYPSVAIWCLDRLVRMIRLFHFGIQEVTLTLVADETIKLTIPKPKYWPIIPGGHAYIYFLKPAYFWQSHPFTFTSSVLEENNIVMYVKIKGGVTHSLYKLLNKSPGKTATMRVGVEGPYGEPSPAKYSDKAVFIAGGNGIPGIYSEVLDIAERTVSERKQVLKLIWVIREYHSILWFYDELLKLKDTNIGTTIYVTRPNSKLAKVDQSNELTKSKSYESDEEQLEKKKAELFHINFEEGRPNIENLIKEEIKESPGSTSFVTCGHPKMVDDIRYYCCKNVDNSEKKKVDFYEQLQVWS